MVEKEKVGEVEKEKVAELGEGGHATYHFVCYGGKLS